MARASAPTRSLCTMSRRARPSSAIPARIVGERAGSRRARRDRGDARGDHAVPHEGRSSTPGCMVDELVRLAGAAPGRARHRCTISARARTLIFLDAVAATGGDESRQVEEAIDAIDTALESSSALPQARSRPRRALPSRPEHVVALRRAARTRPRAAFAERRHDEDAARPFERGGACPHAVQERPALLCHPPVFGSSPSMFISFHGSSSESSCR